jgi:hypothetical protein
VRIAIGLCVGFLFHSVALGGTVTFDPARAVLDAGAGDWGLVSFDVSVAADEFGEFDSVDILFGADSPPFIQFEFAPEFVQSSQVRTEGPPSINTAYAFEWYVGAVMSSPTSSILLGTLTVDMSQVKFGQYAIYVSSDRDSGISYLSTSDDGTEPLFGYAEIIIPEPATLALLAVGSLTVLRRPSRIKPPLPLG